MHSNVHCWVGIFSGMDQKGRNGTIGMAGTRWSIADLKQICHVYHIYYMRNILTVLSLKLFLQFRRMIWLLTQRLNRL